MIITSEHPFLSHGISLFKVYWEYSYLEIIRDFAILPNKNNGVVYIRFKAYLHLLEDGSYVYR